MNDVAIAWVWCYAFTLPSLVALMLAARIQKHFAYGIPVFGKRESVVMVACFWSILAPVFHMIFQGSSCFVTAFNSIADPYWRFVGSIFS